MNRSTLKSAGGIGLALITTVVAPVWAVQDKSPWSTNARITIGSDDNLSQAQDSRDKAEDIFTEISGNVAYSRLRNIRQGYTLAGFAKLRQYNDFDSMSSVTLGGSAIYRYQPKLGFTQPFYQISFTTKVEEFEFVQRDSTYYELKLQAKKRLTDRISLALGLAHETKQSEGIVFDSDRSRFFLNSDWRIFSPGVFYASYSYVVGDSTSTIFTGRTPSYSLIAAAEAREFDQALTKHAPGNWLAYRIPSKAHSLTLGYNYPISPSMALDFSTLYADVAADGDNEYQRLQTRFSLLARF